MSSACSVRNLLLSVSFLAWNVGCSRTAAHIGTHNIGERVQLGPVVYTVLEAEWRDHLSTGSGESSPDKKYLLARLSITNASASPITIPLLQVINAKDQSFTEVADVQGLQDWLGLLRPIPPGGTEVGHAVFCISPGDYRLQLTDAGELDRETIALVTIPFRVDLPAQVQ